MKRNGSAVWRGGLKDGKGTVSTDSGVLSNTQYSFSTRFEDEKGTNPEELIAAAHAGVSRWRPGQLECRHDGGANRHHGDLTLEKTDAGLRSRPSTWT
jgi:hypothetical protein